jgi:hypothetical protein
MENEKKPRPVRPWDMLNKSMGRLTPDKVDERLAICYQCPSFLPRTARCDECGCFMKQKAKLANAYCPLGKWDAVQLPSN